MAVHRKMPKKGRLAAGDTMEQYERAYYRAFVDVAKKADPSWELGRPVPCGALDGITRESIETELHKSWNSLL